MSKKQKQDRQVEASQPETTTETPVEEVLPLPESQEQAVTAQEASPDSADVMPQAESQPTDEEPIVSAQDAEPQDAPQAEDAQEGAALSENQPDSSTTDGADAEADAQAEAEAAAKAEADRIKAEKKAARKAKTKAWFAKHKTLVIVLVLVVLVGAGLATGHFVVTRNVAFIHSSEDLAAAVAKGQKTEYIFKSDIIYNDDLVLSDVDLDLNKHILEVKGDLTIKGDGFVGYKKTIWSQPQQGGSVIVEGALSVEGNRVWYSTVTAAATNVVGNMTVDGNMTLTDLQVSGDLDVAGALSAATVTVQGNLAVGGNVNATVTIAHDAIIDGTVATLMDGETVTIKGKATLVDGCQSLYLYPESTVNAFSNVTAYYFVQYLETPSVLVQQVNGSQLLVISNVLNADGYKVTIVGQQQEYNVRADSGAATTHSLPSLDPGNYTVRVAPYADNDKLYIAGQYAEVTVAYSVQLPTPSVALGTEQQEDGAHLIVTIQPVKDAAQYVLAINGKRQTVDAQEGITQVDVGAISVGTYVVSVYATRPNSNYNNSETALSTYFHRAASDVTVQVQTTREGLSAVITGDGTAYYYLVQWFKGDEVISSQSVLAKEGEYVCATALTADEVDSVKVTPQTKGYYTPGNAVQVAIEQPAPQPEDPELTPQDGDDGQEDGDNGDAVSDGDSTDTDATDGDSDDAVSDGDEGNGDEETDDNMQGGDNGENE